MTKRYSFARDEALPDVAAGTDLLVGTASSFVLTLGALVDICGEVCEVWATPKEQFTRSRLLAEVRSSSGQNRAHAWVAPGTSYVLGRKSID